MSAVVFEAFSYAYPGTDKVLDHIDLTVPRGAFTVITGPSGAGKTTLCLAVCGAVPHYFGGALAGTVRVNGGKTTDSTMHDLARQVGTVLEDYESQLVTMTVFEEVAFSLENQGINEKETARRVADALALVGLSGFEDREVASLSGGQKQRLVIASVLAAAPDILVLDEPASALDPQGAEELYRLLGRLNVEQGITIIVVEHDLSRVLPYASDFVLMTGGRIIASGPPSDVLYYMGRRQVYQEGVPPLWQLKLKLEAETGVSFGNWRSEAEAAQEIKAWLSACRQGAAKSA